ncbi:MAG: nucleotidyltransferase, partial [Deltaproteobacteria bacterium]
MKGLIIAAGRGSRLARKGASKPLVPVLGKPIIERIIRTGYQAGIKEFYVVTGFNGDKVRSFLSTLASQLPVSIKHIENDSW